MANKFLKITNADEVVNILKELGFQYLPNNTIHEHWISKLEQSRLVNRIIVSADECRIELVKEAIQFIPVTFSAEMSFQDGMISEKDRVLKVTYSPLFDTMELTMIRTDWNEVIDIKYPAFDGDNLIKYLTLMNQVAVLRSQFMETRFTI